MQGTRGRQRLSTYACCCGSYSPCQPYQNERRVRALGMVTLLALSDVVSQSRPEKSDVWATAVHYWTTVEFMVAALDAAVIGGILTLRSLVSGLRLIRPMVWHNRPRPPVINFLA